MVFVISHFTSDSSDGIIVCGLQLQVIGPLTNAGSITESVLKCVLTRTIAITARVVVAIDLPTTATTAQVLTIFTMLV